MGEGAWAGGEEGPHAEGMLPGCDLPLCLTLRVSLTVAFQAGGDGEPPRISHGGLVGGKGRVLGAPPLSEARATGMAHEANELGNTGFDWCWSTGACWKRKGGGGGWGTRQRECSWTAKLQETWGVL